MLEKLLSVSEAAEVLGVCPGTINNWKHQRRITFVRVGRRTLFRQEDLADLVMRGRVEAMEL
jgi:excisionase family DNA binding protein